MGKKKNLCAGVIGFYLWVKHGQHHRLDHSLGHQNRHFEKKSTENQKL